MSQRSSRFFQNSRTATQAPPEPTEPLTPHTGDAQQLAASAKALDRKLAAHHQSNPAKPTPSKAASAELTDDANAIRAEFHQRSTELSRLKAALVEATQRLDDRTVQLAQMQEQVETQLKQHAGYADLLHRRVAESCREADQLNAESEAKAQRLTAAMREASDAFSQQVERVCAQESGKLNQLIEQARTQAQTLEQQALPRFRDAAAKIASEAVTQAQEQLKEMVGQAIANTRQELDGQVDTTRASLEQMQQQRKGELGDLHDQAAKTIAAAQQDLEASTRQHAQALDEQNRLAEASQQELKQRLEQELTQMIDRVSQSVSQRVEEQLDEAVGELFEQSQRLGQSTTHQINGARRAMEQAVATSREQLEASLNQAYQSARAQVEEADRAAAKVESAVGDADTREREINAVWQTAQEQIEQRADAAMRQLEQQARQRFDEMVASQVDGHADQVSASVRKQAEDLEVRLAKRLRALKDEVDDAVRYAVYRVTGQRPNTGLPPEVPPEAPAQVSPEASSGTTSKPASPATPDTAQSPVDDDVQAAYDRQHKRRRAA